MTAEVTLKSINIENYRSCLKTNLKPNKRMSVLIGINGSGKTNFLSGILLLRKILNIRRYQEISASLKQSAIKTKLNVIFDVAGKEVRYQAILYLDSKNTRSGNEESILHADEKWQIEGVPNYIKIPLSTFGSHSPYYIISGTKQTFIKHRVTYNDLQKMKRMSAQEFLPKQLFDTLTKVRFFVENIKYYSATRFTDPSRASTILEIEDPKNLSLSYRHSYGHDRVLADIYEASIKKKDAFDEFKRIVGSKGLGLIENIIFKDYKLPTSSVALNASGQIEKTKTSKMFVVPQFEIRGRKFSANQLSEGTFKTLSLVFHLINTKSALLLIEEPEVCVHYGLLTKLIDLIKSLSTNKQIIISTHSDLVLDKLSPENIFVVQMNVKQGTCIQGLKASLGTKEYSAIKKYLQSSGNLGELWKHGGLDV